MKKRIVYLLMATLLAFSLTMPCYADEVTTPEEIVTEEVVTTIEETPAETPTEPAEGEVEQTPEADEETPTEEANVADELAQIKDMVEKLSQAEDMSEVKELIASSSTWVVIGAGVLIILSVVGVVNSKFGGIFNVIKPVIGFFGNLKNDNGEPVTLSGELKGVKEQVVNEVKEAMHAEYGELTKIMQLYQEELKNREENEHTIYAMLTLFMTHCKLPDTAKEEILNFATGVKKYSGSVSEIVEKVEAVIQKDLEQMEIPETPVLDEILEEEYMELG
jgi:hypothetical protein